MSEFKSGFPGVPEQTLMSRIRALEKAGLIHQTGRGTYCKGRKMKYIPEVSRRLTEFNSAIEIGISHCLYERDGNIFVEVGRGDMERMYEYLRAGGHRVLRFRDAAPILESLDGFVIVKQMVSGSSTLDIDGVPVPALEKMLVDIVADYERLFLDGKYLQKAFQRSFEVYEINVSRMMRYAGRRNCAQQVKSLVDGLDRSRIALVSGIQARAATEPIKRLWLFGSFARFEERADSDIDLLVDYADKGHRLSLLDISKCRLALESGLGRSIDLVENGFLIPAAVDSVTRDKYLIYERKC